MGMSGYVMDIMEQEEERAFTEACEYYWNNGCDKETGHLRAEEDWIDFIQPKYKHLFEEY